MPAGTVGYSNTCAPSRTRSHADTSQHDDITTSMTFQLQRSSPDLISRHASTSAPSMTAAQSTRECCRSVSSETLLGQEMTAPLLALTASHIPFLRADMAGQAIAPALTEPVALIRRAGMALPKGTNSLTIRRCVPWDALESRAAGFKDSKVQGFYCETG